MFKTLWEKILSLFGRKTNPNTDDNKNDWYIEEYEKIDRLNITAMISNRLAKYTYFKSEIGVGEDNKRALEINDILKLVWDNKNKIVSRAYGTGGVVLFPAVSDDGILDFSIISQNRIYITKMQRGKITGATILLDTIEETNRTYYLWSDCEVVNNVLTCTQRATLGTNKIPLTSVPKWEKTKDFYSIGNVDRVLIGYIKSPVDNRKTTNDYGVPITYGTEATIKEIHDHLKKIIDEYGVKDAFVGVDYTLFNQDKNGKVELPESKLWKKLNSGKDDFFEVFSPAIRDTSYYVRLKELYMQLENEIGLSDGTLTAMPSFTTATQFRKALFDTLQVIQEMQDNIEKGLEDFVYACNVLLNRAGMPLGETTTYYNWSEALTEDTQQIFTNDITMMDKGLKSKAEVRAYQTGETMEEAQEKIDEIKTNEPSVADLLGNSNE